VNTADFLNIATAICPDRDAMVFEGKRRTYSQVSDRVNRLANALLKFGVSKGDRIAMLQVNCPEIVESYFSTVKIGGIFVPLNFRAKSDELGYMLGNAEARVLFVGKRYLDMARAILPDLPTIAKCVCLDSKETDMLSYDDIINQASTDEVPSGVGDDDDITILMYTAGTTGRPKGVPLRHDAFVSYVLGNVEPASPDVEERNLLTVPLYHVAGMQGMLAAIYGGRTLVMMRQFEVKEWLETVQREKATRAMLVPTMLKMVIDYPDFAKYDLSSLKVITYGAASMPFEVINKAIRVMPRVQFINAFGQTETASTITALGPEDHVIEGTEEEKQKKLKRLSQSIGRPLPDVEVKILDEQRKELPPLEIGDIVAKGPRIMTGYWRDEQKTKQAFTADGWLITGDRGWRDEDGYIFLAGRGDDMIIRGGENISPEELEDVLHSHPKVEEAAVIGVPDPEWGQQPRAIVVLKRGEAATAEELMEYCRAKLASFKRPRSIAFVDSLPRNPLGKVIRKALREQYGKP
jgi:acyl-CoA synthetase (AMP-forming)/AMP-acid ligase II